MAILIDSAKIDQDAQIEDGTILFRLASPLYSSQTDLLNGRGALHGPGRYHRIHQHTSYVSDNALVCMAEVLYHMSRLAMNTLVNNGPPSQWQSRAQVSRHLVIFEASAISDLIYIDTRDCRHLTLVNTRRAIPSTVIVHPDCIYDHLHEAGDYYRAQNKKGIVYPSARNSAPGIAVALFLDHTASIRQILATLRVTLTLVEEKTGAPAVLPAFDPNESKISHIRGFYEFDPSDFASYRTHLRQNSILQSDRVEFVRQL
jgi:hypothetical protein